MRWVVQSNLGNQDDARAIEAACIKLGQPCEMLKIIPFSGTVPNVSGVDMPTTFYGGTGWIGAVHKANGPNPGNVSINPPGPAVGGYQWWPGPFFDEQRFSWSTVRDHYGSRMLNARAMVSTMTRFIEWSDIVGRGPDELVFIRPNLDSKQFNGEVIRYGDFQDWYNVISRGRYDITPNTVIVTAEPVNIDLEYRCFMVDGQVSSASLYRRDGRLSKSADVPEPVLHFAKHMADRWSPAPVFVLDVAVQMDTAPDPVNGISWPQYRVIETGCINSAGFYLADVEKVVTDVSRYCDAQWAKADAEERLRQ